MNAERRARKLQAVPSWADLEVIKEFFINRPAGYHVDHIVPLRAKWQFDGEGNRIWIAGGLHVIENLQYLTGSENCKKGCWFDHVNYEM